MSTVSAATVQVMPTAPAYDSGRIIPDAMYRFREAAAYARLEGPELRDLLDRAGIKPTCIKGREFIYGASLLEALEATR